MSIPAPTKEQDIRENYRMPWPLYIPPKSWPFYVYPRYRWLVGGYSIGYRPDGSASVRMRAYGAPLWLLTLLLGIGPGIALRRTWRLRYRRRHGLCLRCGYDLRASGGPCPECGVETDRALQGKT